MASDKKRPTGTAVDWRERRNAITAGALPLFIERPWSSMGVDEIAAHIGISYWQVYYSFDGLEDIYRACVSRLVDTIADRIDNPPAPHSSVNRTVQDYVRHAADIVASEEYRHLLFLRLRDGHSEHWLKTAYDGKVAEPLRTGLEAAVAEAGERHDLKIVLLHGARERCLMMLETALALPKLLHDGDIVDDGFDRTVTTISKEVFAATCTFDGFDQTESAAA
ncbi:MAG: TetR/AcrR family transcriptional regulator [Pseudomonadota bacterium]